MLEAPKNFPYEKTFPERASIGKMSKKIVVPVVLVLVATLGAFFAVNSQLASLQSNPAQSQDLGSVIIQFASTGLDAASQGQGNGQGHGHTTTGTITNVV